MRDALLAKVRTRLALFAEENSPDVVLSDDAVLEVMNLLNATPDPSTDTEVLLAAGLLHWARYVAQSGDEGRPDLARARELLSTVRQSDPDLLPGGIRDAMDEAAGNADGRERLAHRAERLFAQSTRTRDEAALSEAITLFRRASALTPASHSSHAGILSNLATALQRRFFWSGSESDIDEAVELGRLAASRTPEDDPSRSLVLSGLSGSLWARCVQRQSRADLDESLQAIRQAVAAIRPDDPDRGRYLSNLSNILRSRFEWTADESDLDEAIEQGRRAVAMTPEWHPEHATMLTNLAVARQTRFLRTAVMTDLTAAVDLFARAAAATPPDHPHHPVTLGNLSAALLVRALQTGAESDLSAAVESSRQAVAATPRSSPDRARRLTNLGNTLRARFDRAGLRFDLDEAVDACRQAVAATPAGHAERATALANLGAVVGLRADRLALPADVDEAVDVLRRAAAATAAEHTIGPALMVNLGTALSRRARLRGTAADLDEAVAVVRAALAGAESTGNRTVLAAAASDLGHVLRSRFDRTGNLPDLDGSVAAYRTAIDVRGDEPENARSLSGLGLSLWDRFAHTGRSADRDAGIAAFRRAAMLATATPSIRAKAAGAWASLAVTAKDWRQAVAGCATAVDLLRQVAPRSLDRQDQEYRLDTLSRLGTLAAASCLQTGEVERALELWEQGRGVILGQLLDARTDLTDLAAKHPEKAAEFTRARDEFDTVTVTATDDASAGLAASSVVGSGTPGPGRRDGDRRHALEARFTSLVAEIRELPDFARFLLPPTVDDLRQAAGQGPIVAVNVSEVRCDALILTTAGVQLLPLPDLTEEAVRDQALALLSAREHDDEAGLANVLGWLWDVLAGPVLESLGIRDAPAAGAPWPRVWWCLSGLLSFLPVHAAGRHETRSGPAPSTVIDRAICSYTPTIRALSHARGRAPDTAPLVGLPPTNDDAGRALIVAMPHTPDAADLPGAQREADGLARLLHDRVRVLAAEKATRAAVLAALPRTRWVHFACHAQAVVSAPSTSRLLLHDQSLTVLDVNQLRLADAELAYLSACETALPGGDLTEEAMHLASAFQLAGYRHVIATLWPISDRAAVGLAERIYRTLDDGGDVAAAVHDAVRASRDRAPSSPSRWASHIHVGA
ncbi:CHAT domain-containing protein [Cryptosporangium sp. NPDC051539]|uniref:CHAT domain-containing tetratricopeptide repeat protein n=1 Tax=Cryptosporangium sp. NPDC051539 TaxID=3363962 RepID=UPI0037AFF031